MDTFIEKTIFSEKTSYKGDINDAGTLRREEAKEEEERSLEKKLNQMKEHAQSERGRQSKGVLPNANEVMREQEISDVEAALYVQEKVNAICSLIHNSLSGLAHCVQCFNYPSAEPEITVA